MRLMDVMTAPWAIQPDMLREIRGIYETHLRGDKIDLAGVEARLGRPLHNEEQGYDVIDGVAVVPIHGVVAKRMNLFTRISNGASSELVMRDVQAAIEDPNVKAIILDVDSPGGTVNGSQEAASAIYEARGQKPIVTLANGLMASAGVWMGAAADKVYMSGDTTVVGSIGVLATHVDKSGAEEKTGVKTTEIFAGKYKRINSGFAPLTEEGREYMQAQVDYMYSVFVSDVAKFRGVPVSTVLDNMADGRLFIGQQAVDAGLVDGISTLDALIADLSMGRMPEQSGAVAAVTDEPELSTNVNEENDMSVDITKGFVAENHPDIAEAFRQEGAETARADGATAERERIQSVLAQGAALPGHDALVQGLAFDGKTTGPEAAVAILGAEQQNRDKVVADIAADAPEPVSQPSIDDDMGADADAHLPIEERCQAKWDKTPALREEYSSFSTYLHYTKAVEKGQVRVLSK